MIYHYVSIYALEWIAKQYRKAIGKSGNDLAISHAVQALLMISVRD
jgi:hypothetical protein